MKRILNAALIVCATAAIGVVRTPVTTAGPVPAVVPRTTAGPQATAPAAAATAGTRSTPGTAAAPQNAAPASPLAGLPAAGPKNPHGCLAGGDGYLRVRIRGALALDVSLRNAELECDGGPRPDGSGIRVSFAGPERSDGRRLRMVFGVAQAKEGVLGRELPTNLTVIFEGEQRMFATRGDDKCTVDEFKQERVGALGGPIRNYRVIARGFCITPVKALNSEQSILVNSFDFAGAITFEDTPAADATRRGPLSAK